MNAISTLSNIIAELSFHMVHNMLHVISALCAARDLHTIGPLEYTCWKQFAVQ